MTKARHGEQLNIIELDRFHFILCTKVDYLLTPELFKPQLPAGRIGAGVV